MAHKGERWMKKLVYLAAAMFLMGCETGIPCQSDEECGEGAFCGADPYNSQPICVQGCLEDADCGDYEACHQGQCVERVQEIRFSTSRKRTPGRPRRRQPRPVEGFEYNLGQAENPAYERVTYSSPPVYAGNSGEEDEDHPFRTIPPAN